MEEKLSVFDDWITSRMREVLKGGLRKQVQRIVFEVIGDEMVEGIRMFVYLFKASYSAEEDMGNVKGMESCDGEISYRVKVSFKDFPVLEIEDAVNSSILCWVKRSGNYVFVKEFHSEEVINVG